MWKQAIFLAVVASQVGATDCGEVLRDPGFDVWCGDTLCAWTVERGDIARAPTWHDKDSGVALVGDDVAIAQLAPVTNSDGTCIVFSMVADVETAADVALNIDVEGDGSVERSESIPNAHWAPQKFAILIAPPFDGVRFELTKRGGGKAVVAQIDARVDATACDGSAAIAAAGKRPNGARCATSDDCADGFCPLVIFGTATCQGCQLDTQDTGGCPATAVCGLGDPALPTIEQPIECIAKASKALGERCLGADECASGICDAGGRCGGCATPGAACSGGLACRESYPGLDVCGGASGAVATGGACGADADCASHHCAGAAREECEDGRACRTAADCPVASGDGGLVPGHCTTVGVQGGTCQ